jgi:Sulfocyanin (SoxE) domain
MTFRLALTSACLFTCAICASACDPVMGTGAGNPPDLSKYIRIDSAAQSAVITLVAGYPAGDYQFNYNGYASGALVITVPAGWHATVQCENRSTVPNSCAVVGGKNDLQPLAAGWSTPDPVVGLAPGDSASFEFDPVSPGSFRIASLVKGSEASGMWAVLDVSQAGLPSMAAPWN